MDAYSTTAEAYDLIHQARGHSFAHHADAIADAARARCPAADSLLDVACGTGLHLVTFKERFDRVAGVDLSPGMLARARERLPGVALHEGDMRLFDLRDQFDVVTCLFSSVGYMLLYTDLRQAIGNMAAHVAPGGVLLVEPWIHPDGWHVPHITAESATGDGIAVGRVSTNGRYDDISTFTLHWTIATSAGVEYVVEDHELGLYSVDQYRDALVNVGLDVVHDPEGPSGRGLFVGVKPN